MFCSLQKATEKKVTAYTTKIVISVIIINIIVVDFYKQTANKQTFSILVWVSTIKYIAVCNVIPLLLISINWQLYNLTWIIIIDVVVVGRPQMLCQKQKNK